MFIKIFINFETNKIEVIKSIIEKSLYLQLDNDFYFRNDVVTIELRENEEYDPSQAIIFPDGFLYFSHYLEIELSETRERSIPLISNLLNRFWQTNIPAVTASDIEEELPYKGGYNSKLVPWISS